MSDFPDPKKAAGYLLELSDQGWRDLKEYSRNKVAAIFDRSPNGIHLEQPNEDKCPYLIFPVQQSTDSDKEEAK